MTTCTKNVNGPCENEATEFLWVRGLWDGEWESHPRCTGHPADDDIALIRRMYPMAETKVVTADTATGLHLLGEVIAAAFEVFRPAAEPVDTEADR